jgi:hypothetical protein
MFNQNDVRNLQERQKDLRREVEQQRLAKQSRSVRQTQRTTQKNLSLWTRIWMFL